MATTNGHPATPPPTTASASATATAEPSKPTNTIDTADPLSSTQDDGLSRRPRDARLIHLILHAQGIHSYQERVPLQLLDFAYRYTSGVLSDSLRLAAEGYSNTTDRPGKKGQGDESNITVTALRQAIASRMSYTFAGALPKEFIMEEAAKKNIVALPKVERGYGVELPDEKYCLTGVGWGLRDEWSDEEDVPVQQDEVGVRDREDQKMGGVDGAEDDDEEGAGRMEDVFGAGDTNMTQD